MVVKIGLTGKKALVFGIANDKSIAWHIAKRLSEAGCRVICGYQERNEENTAKLKKENHGVLFEKFDVADEAIFNNFFDKTKKEFQNVDLIIHSIAFAKKENLKGRLIDTEKKDFDIAMEVSAFSLIKLIKKFETILNDNGSIIALTYIGSQKVVANYNVMGVAKSALEAIIKYAANDLGARGIRVNGISAGPIATSASLAIKGFVGIMADSINKSPLKRAVKKEEVADAALFFCSDLSSGITGEVIYVDCGYNIMA